MKLSEFIEKYPEYKPYVELLKNFFEKPVDEIEMHSFMEATRYKYIIDENILGFAVPPNEVFFRDIPPDLHVFIHEMIHLCKKPPVTSEEIYAYNLVNLVVFCVEKRIKCNPFALLTLTVSDIERVLSKYGIESIEEYYNIAGIIPVNYVVDFDEEGKMVGIKPSRELLEHPGRDRIIVETFISELVAGIHYYTDESIETKILLDLIEIAGGSR